MQTKFKEDRIAPKQKSHDDDDSGEMINRLFKAEVLGVNQDCKDVQSAKEVLEYFHLTVLKMWAMISQMFREFGIYILKMKRYFCFS